MPEQRLVCRSSVAGGAKLYTAKTFNLHRGDTAQEDDATDIQDSAHVDTLQQVPQRTLTTQPAVALT